MGEERSINEAFGAPLVGESVAHKAEQEHLDSSNSDATTDVHSLDYEWS